MQLLPKTATFRDWGFTLLSLSLITFVIVINLHHVTRWTERLRPWNDFLLKKAAELALRILHRKRRSNVGDSDADIELNQITGA